MADDPVSEFVSITEASAEVAVQFLNAFNNDVQEAVSAFFDPNQFNKAPQRHAPIDSDDELLECVVNDNDVREPMKQVRRRLVQEDLPVGRGRAIRDFQPTEAFRDLRAEQALQFGG